MTIDAIAPARSRTPAGRTEGVRVAVVDYGAGNLVSIAQGLEAIGAVASVATAPSGLRDIDALIVPGVGAAAPAMKRLGTAGLVGPIRDWIAGGRPYLGICLGLQLLFETSDEDGAEMLGVIPGRVSELRDAPTLPHIGWNQVDLVREHPLFEGIGTGTDLYFVHSFAGEPDPVRSHGVTLATTTHGATFVSAIAAGRCAGVQFHPERSGVAGLRLLGNFARLAAGNERGSAT